MLDFYPRINSPNSSSCTDVEHSKVWERRIARLSEVNGRGEDLDGLARVRHLAACIGPRESYDICVHFHTYNFEWTKSGWSCSSNKIYGPAITSHFQTSGYVSGTD